MKIPFDVSYHFDDRLHDVPNSPAQMQQAVNFLQSEFDKCPHDIRRQIYLAGSIGGYARMLHDFTTAEQALNTALQLCDRINDKSSKIANSIRLAHLYQWQQRYELSETLFEVIVKQCKSDSYLTLYLDFAYQHAGKCKFARGKYEEAQHYFALALELRQQKGDRSLIDSTKLALNMVQQRINY